MSDERLQQGYQSFVDGLLGALKSPSALPIYVDFDLVIWRYVSSGKGIPSQHKGFYLFHKNDLRRMKYLPPSWWYFLSDHGEGIQVDIPLKMKPVLSWSPATFYKKRGKLCQTPRFPREKLFLTVVKTACNLENLG